MGSFAGPSEACPLALEEGGGPAPSRLECPKCSRKFSNTRQLRKHICIIVLNLGEDEADAGTCPAGRGGSLCRAPAACQLSVISIITWK